MGGDIMRGVLPSFSCSPIPLPSSSPPSWVNLQEVVVLYISHVVLLFLIAVVFKCVAASILSMADCTLMFLRFFSFSNLIFIVRLQWFCFLVLPPSTASFRILVKFQLISSLSRAACLVQILNPFSGFLLCKWLSYRAISSQVDLDFIYVHCVVTTNLLF